MEGDGDMIKDDSRGKNMVKRKYVISIAFVTIILSTFLMVVGAVSPFSFNTPPTPPDAGTVSVNYVNISISLAGPGTALINSNGTGNESMSGSGTSFYKNKTGLTNGPYSYIVYANDSTP